MDRCIVVIFVLLAGCALLRDPSERNVHEFRRPDGGTVRCHEPPADAIAAGLLAELDAKIPEVLDVLNLRVDVAQRVELLRPAVPNLQALEALEFRMCVAWAQGVIGEEVYEAFLLEVVPLLREGCERAAEGSP